MNKIKVKEAFGKIHPLHITIYFLYTIFWFGDNVLSLFIFSIVGLILGILNFREGLKYGKKSITPFYLGSFLGLIGIIIYWVYLKYDLRGCKDPPKF